MGVQFPAAVRMAGELVAHGLAELPALAALDDRDRLLAAAWLASLRSARTRRSYAADLLGWQAWLAERGLELLGAGRVHVDLWVRAQQLAGAGDASVRRRLSGVARSTGTVCPTTWRAGIRRRGWRGHGWTRTTPPPSGCPANRAGR